MGCKFCLVLICERLFWDSLLFGQCSSSNVHHISHFGRDFWNDGYRSITQEDDGFDDRALLYNAYHQLNHFNLFGGSYLTTAKSDLNGIKDALDRIEFG